MRIVQAMAGGGPGGAEAFFARLCVALEGAGARGAGLVQRVVVRRGAAVLEPLQAGGIRPLELPFGGWLDWRSPGLLGREIRRFRPDLVLTWMSRATRACPKGDFVHAARLGGYYPLRNYRRCDHLIGNTRDIVDWAIQAGWPAERVHYLPNFVAETKAAPVARASFDTPEGVPLLLALGRLHRNKGFDVLLEALARVPGAWLWLAGAGPEEANLRQQAERLGLVPRLRFLGWRQDVPALLASADLLVCPSRHEPLGNVVIEAFAHSRPVVAAAAKGPAALIRDGENGLLVPCEDAAALAAALSRLIGQPALAARLAEAGRASFEAEFTETAVVGRYLDFFHAIAREKVGGSCAA